MKLLRNSLSFLLLVSIIAVSSCSDDKKSNPTPVDTPDNVIENQDDVDLVVSALQGEITGDITLAASENWILTGPLVVSAGGKLTIEAGTTIKAQAGGTDVYIGVERGATIKAVGTAANPIKITSNASSPKAGDWGGLLLMGYAPITGGGEAVTEVVDFIYGGSDAADDSGDLAYLIIEYSGARINGEKEFNGLTLYGVGSGTSISNIGLFYGDDDAIEFFGGTVNVSNVFALNAKDDMFDWTQGWSGTGTNLYGKRELGFDEETSDPRGIEADGNLDGNTPSLTPQSNPTINNITIVNNSTVVGLDDVFKIRRGSGATITNALVIYSSNTPAPDKVVNMSDSKGYGNGANTSISVTLNGDNLDAANIKNDDAGNEATLSFPTDNTGIADPATMFGWTGYSSF